MGKRDMMEKIEKLAKNDALYQDMLQQNKLLEERFDHLAKDLDQEKRAVLWDFVMHCEDMSVRKLELACSLLTE